MAFKLNNFLSNDDINQVESKGCFTILEYKKDLSVNYPSAINEYFAAQMNVRRKQLLIKLNGHSIILQAGALQWSVGNVEASTGIKGVGDFFSKAVRGAVTGESAIKPEYKGQGVVLTEPTYKHLLIEDLDDWQGSMVVEDGMFLAADSEVTQRAVMVQSVSGVTLGKEGLFNLGLEGKGFVVLESPVPRNELIAVDLQNETLKIDGSLAVAWSGSLSFTVERSGKSLLGSAASGEGLVNVYRGTGRVLMSPVAQTR